LVLRFAPQRDIAETMRRLSSCAVRALPLTRGYVDAQSVLGTDALGSDVMKTIASDLQNAGKLGGAGPGRHNRTFSDCLRKAELDHMESPEADKRHFNKCERQISNFFDNLPTPADPMKAALMPTENEAEESDRVEMLKDIVRERYHGKLSRKGAERKRVAAAMQEVADGTHPMMNRRPRHEDMCVDEPAMSPADAETLRLSMELEMMKRKVAALEKQLKSENRSD
jgi:hypothetical protein